MGCAHPGLLYKQNNYGASMAVSFWEFIKEKFVKCYYALSDIDKTSMEKIFLVSLSFLVFFAAVLPGCAIYITIPVSAIFFYWHWKKYSHKKTFSRFLATILASVFFVAAWLFIGLFVGGFLIGAILLGHVNI